MSPTSSVASPIPSPIPPRPLTPDLPRAGGREDELARLRLRCRGRELAVERLVASVAMLRRVNDGLRAENRELVAQLERLRRGTR